MREEAGENDVEGVEMDPSQTCMRPAEVAPRANSTLRNAGDKMDVDEEQGDTGSTTRISGDGAHSLPEAIPLPDLRQSPRLTENASSLELQ